MGSFKIPSIPQSGNRPVLLALLSLILIGGLVVVHTSNVLEFPPLANLCGMEHQRYSDPTIDYTDPFNITRDVFYGIALLCLKTNFPGPWRADFPQTVTAGQQFEITFYCMAKDQSLCPSYYRLFFQGPTRQNVPPSNFSKVEKIENDRYSHVKVTARWTIYDAGEYLIYAYPEFGYCAQWLAMDWPFFKASVEGTPAPLRVISSRDPREEGYGACATSEDVLDGRYLSTDSSLSPEDFADHYKGLQRDFSWAPYSCKIPPRNNVTKFIASIPSAKNFVFMGDSTGRRTFCVKVMRHVHGTIKGTCCDDSDFAGYEETKFHHKYSYKEFEMDNGETRNVSFNFLWTAQGFEFVKDELLKMTPGPTHIVFNVGL